MNTLSKFLSVAAFTATFGMGSAAADIIGYNFDITTNFGPVDGMFYYDDANVVGSVVTELDITDIMVQGTAGPFVATSSFADYTSGIGAAVFDFTFDTSTSMFGRNVWTTNSAVGVNFNFGAGTMPTVAVFTPAGGNNRDVIGVMAAPKAVPLPASVALLGVGLLALGLGRKRFKPSNQVIS